MLETAMIFAAGFGTRMGDLTKDRPKPLIDVAGRPLIDYALDFLRAGGIQRIVVNTHYHADQLEEYLARYDDVCTIREEPDILETGGGLRNALQLLGNEPVFTLNSDIIWGGQNPIDEMRRLWQPEKMDALMAVIPLKKAIGFSGAADFSVNENNQLQREAEASHIYTGIQILKTDGLLEIEEDAFSVNKLWDKMITRNRAYAYHYDQKWVDVGKPEGIALAEAVISSGNV